MSKTTPDRSPVIPTLNGAHRLRVICQWLAHCNFSSTCIVMDTADLIRLTSLRNILSLIRPLSANDAIESLALGMQRINAILCISWR